MKIYTRVEVAPAAFKDDVGAHTLYPVAQMNGTDVLCYGTSRTAAEFIADLLNREKERQEGRIDESQTLRA